MPTASRSAVRPNIRDLIFAELAVRDAKVPAEVIEKGWAVLDELGRFGISRFLSDILVERKFIDRGKEKEVMREFGKIQVPCARCHVALFLEDLNKAGQLRCRQCESALRLEVVEGKGGAGQRIEERLRTHLLQGAEQGREQTPRKNAPATKASPGAARETRPGRPETQPDKPPPAAGSSPSGEKPENAPRRLQARVAIKKYSIGGIISSGPYGRLYRARPAGDETNEAIRALKIFAPEYILDSKAAVALKETLGTWSRMDGEAPDPPHTLEQEETFLYLVRPYLGEPYVALCDFPITELKERDQIFRLLAAHLGVIHQAGRIHGNLKPSNVFLDRKGLQRVLLVDPGLHLFLDRKDTMARYKFLAEAPHYRSPEEIGGGEPTAASDVYALGWIFYFALTGSHPFAGLEPPETLRRHREGPCPELPPEAGEWQRLHRAMTALDPRERPPNGKAVRERIEEIISGGKATLGEVTSRPTRAGAEALPEQGKKRRTFIWQYALGPVALLLVLSWVGFCFSSWREARETLSVENRTAALLYRMAEEAFRTTKAQAESDPLRGREVWDRYLELFTGTPFDGAAKVERSNFIAPVPIPHRK